MPRPPTGQTPLRSIRVGDEIWEHVERAAEEDGTTTAHIVRQALLEYAAKRARLRRRQREQRQDSSGGTNADRPDH